VEARNSPPRAPRTPRDALLGVLGALGGESSWLRQRSAALVQVLGEIDKSLLVLFSKKELLS
jgi:hypothetical protein